MIWQCCFTLALGTLLDLGRQTRYESLASMIFSAYVSLHLSHSAAYTALHRIHFSSFLSLYKLVLLTSYLAFITRYFNILLVVWLPKDWIFVPIFLYTNRFILGKMFPSQPEGHSRSSCICRSKAWAPNDAGFRVLIVSKHDVLRLVKTTWASWEYTKVANEKNIIYIHECA
jgi:hypothetical protein